MLVLGSSNAASARIAELSSWRSGSRDRTKSTTLTELGGPLGMSIVRQERRGGTTFASPIVRRRQKCKNIMM